MNLAWFRTLIAFIAALIISLIAKGAGENVGIIEVATIYLLFRISLDVVK